MNDHPERNDENAVSSKPPQPIAVAPDAVTASGEASDSRNPYAPARILSGDENASVLPTKPEKPYEPRTPLQAVGLWAIVCGIAAAPSFVLGLGITGGQFAGMITGILIFVGIYSWADLATQKQNWRRDTTIRSTLRWTYGLRLVVSICFPVGFVLDMMCGGLTVQMTQMLTHESLTRGPEFEGVASVLLATLIQGTLLNIVLAVFATLLYLIRIGSRAFWAKIH